MEKPIEISDGHAHVSADRGHWADDAKMPPGRTAALFGMSRSPPQHYRYDASDADNSVAPVELDGSNSMSNRRNAGRRRSPAGTMMLAAQEAAYLPLQLSTAWWNATLDAWCPPRTRRRCVHSHHDLEVPDELEASDAQALFA